MADAKDARSRVGVGMSDTMCLSGAAEAFLLEPQCEVSAADDARYLLPSRVKHVRSLLLSAALVCVAVAGVGYCAYRTLEYTEHLAAPLASNPCFVRLTAPGSP
jgi:hypothetical protein